MLYRSVTSGILLAVAGGLLSGLCRAQPDSVRVSSADADKGCRSLAGTLGNDALSALGASAHVLGSPFRWEGEDWLHVSKALAVTGVGVLLDGETFRLMERNRSAFSDDLSGVAVEYGGRVVGFGVPAAVYLTGLLLGDAWVRETGVALGTASVLTSALTSVGKIAVGRARPSAGYGSGEFRPFLNQTAFKSFPSGHATTAFVISAVLAARIKQPWITAGLYTLATLASVSRMYSRSHWLSDVLFTGIYADAVGRSIVRWLEGGDERCGSGALLLLVPVPHGVACVVKF